MKKRNYLLKNKSGVSPVVATVLLISMVVVLALIVILWFLSMTEEAVTKFDGQNVEIVCRDVSFEASYGAGKLLMENTGSVPIFKAKVKKESAGEFTTEEISTEPPGNWPSKGLNPGKAVSLGYDAGSASVITIIPVLVGESESGMNSYTCDEKQTGYELTI